MTTRKNGVVRGRRRWPALVTVIVAVLLSLTTAASADVSHALIDGSGSSWAYPAIRVWEQGASASGLAVNFTSTGSAQGRKDFGNSTNDFAVSDIGYQGKDKQTGNTDLPCPLGGATNCRDYAYLPIVSGGTSFPYHILQGGKLVNNLRLSGQTLAKIFTGGITDWSDAAITKDNNGRQLPALQIIPVVHTEGSGSTAQFTRYLDQQYPAIWQPYAGGPGPTEYYKAPSNGVSYNGSDGIISFITSAAANGSIGYDEYSYPLGKNYPVAKIENAFGNYTLPTQYNVAVALQQAKINMDKGSADYLLQDLSQVYTDGDPRTYPLSSYSYAIIPTSATDGKMSTAKRQTLADFLYYSVCDGQNLVAQVGYSSLPLNLVQASFDQVSKLHDADPKVDLTNRVVTNCKNPTFVPGDLSGNHLADIAPPIPACDKSGAGPCADGGDPGTAPVAPVAGAPTAGSTPVPGATSGPSRAAGPGGGIAKPGKTIGVQVRPGTSPSAGAKPGSSKSDARGVISGQTSGATAGPVGSAGSGDRTTQVPGSSGSAGVAKVATTTDPETGLEVPVAGNTAGDPVAAAASTVPTLVAYRQQNMTGLLGPLAVLGLLAVLVVPPLFYFYIVRPRKARR